MFLLIFLDDKYEWDDFAKVVDNYVCNNEILPLQDFIGMHFKDIYLINWVTSIELIDAMDKAVELFAIPDVVKSLDNDSKWVCQKCGEIVEDTNVTFNEYKNGIK